MDNSQWPRRFLWHGWLPSLSGSNGASSLPKPRQVWVLVLSVQTLLDWDLAQDVDAESVLRNLPQHPNVWSDWSLFSVRCSVWCFFSWVTGAPGSPKAWCRAFCSRSHVREDD